MNVEMLRLDIEFSDGFHSHAWGDIETIEAAIADAAESGKAIATWAVTDRG